MCESRKTLAIVLSMVLSHEPSSELLSLSPLGVRQPATLLLPILP